MEETAPRTTIGALVLEGLRKTFRQDGGEVVALDGVTLRVRPGEFLSVVGASGCGKSTLLRVVAGLEQVDAGEAALSGERIRGPGLDRGIVFQEHRLFPWLTVEENVGFGLDALPADERRRTVAEHVALVGLRGFERAYPHQLSGGMAQRVSIARALASRPRVLLLDEPFGALDAFTRMQMQEELLRIWQAERCTVVLVTHDIDEAVYLGDRVVVMCPRPGRVRTVADVALARPRDRVSPDFTQLRAAIYRELFPARAVAEDFVL
ncbi:MAG: ABC transporter ATP-binding protein [Anaeromyxobacteraceae bacterium]